MTDKPSYFWYFSPFNILGCVLVLLSPLLLVNCGKTFLAQRRFVAHSEHATGTVVELIEHVDTVGVHSSRKVYSYSPVFTFIDRAGKLQRVTSTERHPRSDSYRIGDPVPVLYNPDASYEAQLDTFYIWWSGVVRDGFFGVAFLVVGLWLARTIRTRL